MMLLYAWKRQLIREEQLQQLLKVLKNNGGHLSLVIIHSLKHSESEYLGPLCPLLCLRIQSRVVTVSPTDTVIMAAKKMLEFHMSSVVVIAENKPHGILTSKDILLRVIADDLPPHSTPVEKVMTSNPECTTVDTPIVNALHIMHNRKFLHLPIVDKDGVVVAVVDVLQVTHAAIATVRSTGLSNEAASTMMQKFWDSAMELAPMDDDEDTNSDNSKLASEAESLPYLTPNHPNTFAFKIQDKKGQMHRFICDTRSLTNLITAILQKLGDDIDRNHLPQILYEDEEHDKVILASDSDLVAAVVHARLLSWKGLKLQLDYSGACDRRKASGARNGDLDHARSNSRASTYTAVAAGAALIAALGVVALWRRSNNK